MTSYQTPKSLKKTHYRLLKENLKLKKKCVRLSNSNNYFQGTLNGVVRRLFTNDHPEQTYTFGFPAFSQAQSVSGSNQQPIGTFRRPNPFALTFGCFQPVPVSTPQASGSSQPSQMTQFFNQILADEMARVGPSGSLFTQSAPHVSAIAEQDTTVPSSPVLACAPRRSHAFSGASAFNSSLKHSVETTPPATSQ